jgi:hypothetical protein
MKISDYAWRIAALALFLATMCFISTSALRRFPPQGSVNRFGPLGAIIESQHNKK